MYKDYEDYVEMVQKEGEEPNDHYFWQECEYDAVTDYIRDRLKREFGYGFTPDKRGIGTVCDDVEFAGNYYSFRIDVTVESGYYDGVCFDYALREINGLFCDEVPGIDWATRWLEDSGMNTGMVKIQAKNLQKRLAAAIEEAQNKIDAILAECTPHTLQLDTLFSNGEAWYSEVKKAS